MKTFQRFNSILLASVFALDSVAQTSVPASTTADRVVYEASFYAPFAPRTALDMVKQTPGFVLTTDDEESQRRGFAGAVGNVLVDGTRLSAKSQTLTDVLQRVPASEVVRIEILRGNAAAGDASGAAVLANVVRTRATGGGAWALGFELANAEEPAPNGWFGWGGRRGVTEYSLGGSTYALQRELPGERRDFDSDGAPTARRRDASPREFAEYALNGQAARPVGGGKLSVTAQAYFSRYHDDSTLLTTTLEGARLENELIPYTESDRVGEAGVTYTHALGGWDMEVAALATRKRHLSHVSSTHFGVTDVQDSRFTQLLQQDSGESIVRATFTRALAQGRFESGAELAVNTLDGASRVALDLGGGPFPILVPNANLAVRENRGEAFVSHAWTLDERWSLESRLAAEVSRLEFTGDTEQSVSLKFLKPRVQLTRRFGPHQVQLRAFRDVGQLDFTDFVSSVEVADEIVKGGNPDLKPQTAWALELDTDLRFPRAALRVRLFRHWLDDVADFLPVGPPGARVDAPGNIGGGSLRGVEISGRVPLDPVLPGGTLTASGTLQDAQARDPVTGERRLLSDFLRHQLKVELREDLVTAKLSWGLSFTGESAKTSYRLAERDTTRKSSSLDAFVETQAISGFKLRLTVLSILDAAEERDRRFFVPDRAGAPESFEVSARHPGHWWLLSLTGAF